MGIFLVYTCHNVFLFIDDMKKPRLYRICRYRNNTFYPKVLAWSTDLCSSDPATLRDLLKYVSTNYPSESYGKRRRSC